MKQTIKELIKECECKFPRKHRLYFAVGQRCPCYKQVCGCVNLYPTWPPHSSLDGLVRQKENE